MKIKVLMENTALSDAFLCEHGLSFYVETEKHTILFDMGQSDAFIKNAKELGADLEKVDIAIVSHGHYDHGGGLEAFLKINSRAKIYINENAFGDYYSVDGRYLGLDKALAGESRIVLTGDEFDIDNGLHLFTGNAFERKHFMDSFGLLKKQKGEMLPDDFLHEQYLVINENGKNILISGCSHKGILNIMDWAKEYKPEAVFGGFHYMKLDPFKDYTYLAEVSEKLMCGTAQYYTCHCTGAEQYGCLKKLMGERLEYICAGDVINL